MQSEYQKTQPKPRRRPVPKGTLLTLTQLAERWQISRHTIYRLMEHKALPCLRIGSVLRYDYDECIEWAREFTACGDKLTWLDDRPELQAKKGPTAELPPSRRPKELAPELGRVPTADVPPSRRRVRPDEPRAPVAGAPRPDPRRTKRRIGV